MSETLDSKAKTIVLVHGGFVDGSGWEVVYKTLKTVQEAIPGTNEYGTAFASKQTACI